MSALKSRQDVLRLAVIAFLTIGIATAGAVSSIRQAAATPPSSANLWAVPVTSCINDGHLQILKFKFFQNNSNPLDNIKITLDTGESVEIDGNGNMVGDPVFVNAELTLTFKTDGYYFALLFLKGKGQVALDKTLLTPGDHTALMEISTSDGVVLTDDAAFKLKECKPKKADLVAEFLWTPHNIQRDQDYEAFFIEANDGNADAGEHDVGLYLSQNHKLGGDDKVGTDTVNMLEKFQFKILHIPFSLAPDAKLGPAWLIANTDDNNEIDEQKENNNDAFHHIRVIAAEDEVAHVEAQDDQGDDSGDDGDQGEDHGNNSQSQDVHSDNGKHKGKDK